MKKSRIVFYTTLLVAFFLYLGIALEIVAIPQPVEHQLSQECTERYLDRDIGSDVALQDASEQLSADDFRMLVWNIHKEEDVSWSKELKEFADQASIIALQEGHDSSSLQSYLQEENLNWKLAKAFSYNGKGAGVLTASVPKPTSECGFYAVEPLLRLPKSILVSSYSFTDRPEQLLVANVHMINFTFGVEAYKAQLTRLEKMVQEHEGPLVVAGDFNSWSNKRSGIVDSFATRLGLQAVEFSHDERSTVFNRPLDHVFARGLNVVTARAPVSTTSDHNPMLIDFSAK